MNSILRFQSTLLTVHNKYIYTAAMPPFLQWVKFSRLLEPTDMNTLLPHPDKLVKVP